MHKRRTYLFPILALTLALAGCAKQPEIPSSSDILGPYTATGTIVGTGASLYRRGTHVLLMDSYPRFFLESRTVDLNAFEGVRAVVQGELFPNTHPTFLPVLQVSAVVPQGGRQALPLQRYDVPLLGLSLEAPSEWEGKLSEGSLTFRLPVEGAIEPFLVVGRSAEKELPQGFPLRIGGENAVRFVDEADGQHRVYVSTPRGDTLLFTFTPKGLPEVLPLRDAFYALLRSVRFDEGRGEGDALNPGSASGSGPLIPCGGPAHVLCPEGQFCEVRELETGIGVCQPLR
jgi:hypothetical protein